MEKPVEKIIAPEEMDFPVVGIIIAIFSVIITIGKAFKTAEIWQIFGGYYTCNEFFFLKLSVLFIFWSQRKSRGQTVVLAGLCDSGKTLIYARLMHSKHVQTHTSIAENTGDLKAKKVS